MFRFVSDIHHIWCDPGVNISRCIILIHREQRGGSHDADIDKRLQTATSDLLQVAQVSDQAKARLLGKTKSGYLPWSRDMRGHFAMILR
jgi:hypothetical protein